jgi:hypothetical protein
MGVDVAACLVDVELRQRRVVGSGPVTSTWSIGVGSSSKNLPSRSKSVASKAAMLAPSFEADAVQAIRAVSSPMPALPPITTTVCPSSSGS